MGAACLPPLVQTWSWDDEAESLPLLVRRASLVAQLVKNPPAM